MSGPTITVRISPGLLEELTYLEGEEVADPSTPGSVELSSEIEAAWRERRQTLTMSRVAACELERALYYHDDIWKDKRSSADPSARARNAAFQRAGMSLRSRLRAELGLAPLT